jgi:hypothetical protein
MNYANYSYYSGTYGGSMIPEEQFNYCAARASEYIDQQTYDRISAEIPEELTNKISSCCCELAENIYRFSAASSGSGTSSGAGADISSEKIGQYSVTYHTGAETISALLNGNDTGLNDLLYSTISRHLGNTGLLYKGVD